jgi:hypothetical protein
MTASTAAPKVGEFKTCVHCGEAIRFMNCGKARLKTKWFHWPSLSRRCKSPDKAEPSL